MRWAEILAIPLNKLDLRFFWVDHDWNIGFSKRHRKKKVVVVEGLLVNI